MTQNSIYNQAKGTCSVCGKPFSTHQCRKCISAVENADLVDENQELRRIWAEDKKKINFLQAEVNRLRKVSSNG